MSRIYELLGNKESEAAEHPPVVPQDQTSEPATLSNLLIDNCPEASEEFSCLYRNTLILGKGRLKTLLVCAAKRGEGTSTIAASLATYIARSDEKPTLLVETDARSSRPLVRENGKAREGFSDLLEHQAPASNYITPTTVNQLFVMGAGRRNDLQPEIWTNSRLENALEDIRGKYHMTILDGPSAQEGGLSLKLAGLVDGVILVVKAPASCLDLQQAKKALDQARANIVGVVLNR
jgi:Mrp family chromosome partitioning ATPase